MYAEKVLKKHPHANPHRGRLGHKGYFWALFTMKNGDRLIGRVDGSRWMPHQGEQEIARRLRQAEGRSNG